jgi:hypothetical protein
MSESAPVRRYDSGMNPTVTGALIAGAAALIGFGASALTNGATLRANRRLARDQMFWQKKTELYEVIGSELQFDFPDLMTDSGHEAIKAFLGRLDELTSRVKLYAGEGVQDTYDRLGTALALLTEIHGGIAEWNESDVENRRLSLADAMRWDLQGKVEMTRMQRFAYRLSHRFRLAWERRQYGSTVE